MTKQMIGKSEELHDFQDTSLDDAIKILQDAKALHGGDASLYIDANGDNDGYFSITVEVCFKALESDVQYQARLEREKRYKERTEAAEAERLAKEVKDTKISSLVAELKSLGVEV
tara:strand:+ start:718 stop:1062 length:345 start_codon:yes stop_codon:yes gene_type:complete